MIRWSANARSFVTSALTSAAIACSAIFAMPYDVNAAKVAGWSAEIEPGGNACLLHYSTGSLSIHFYRDTFATDAYIVVPGADLPEGFKFTWSPDTGPDRLLDAAVYEDDEGHKFSGDSDMSIDDLLLELEPASRLTIRITQQVVRIVAMQTYASAFSKYRKCSARFAPNENAQSTDAHSAQESHQQEEDEPADLADTLADRQSPVLASFRCEITSSVLFGVPDMTGTGKFDDVTIDIFDDGSATYNGSRLKAQIVQKSDDGSFEFTTYDVREIMAAAAPDPNAPPVILNEDQAQQYAGLLGAFSGMSQMVLGNRTRSLLVSLKNDTVVFFDHSNGNQITNERAPRCVRVR